MALSQIQLGERIPIVLSFNLIDNMYLHRFANAAFGCISA